jgi:predicted translin family RNA/ssDNA-binding protein
LHEKYDRLTQVNESLCYIASYSSSLEDLKNKDDINRKQVEDLPSTLAKFTSFITIHLSAAKLDVYYKYY